MLLLRNRLGLLWQMTKLDINSTISNVCTKVLHDGSQSPEQIEKRKEALFRLGEEYCAKSVEEEQGGATNMPRAGHAVLLSSLLMLFLSSSCCC